MFHPSHFSAQCIGKIRTVQTRGRKIRPPVLPYHLTLEILLPGALKNPQRADNENHKKIKRAWGSHALRQKIEQA